MDDKEKHRDRLRASAKNASPRTTLDDDQLERMLNLVNAPRAAESLQSRLLDDFETVVPRKHAATTPRYASRILSVAKKLFSTPQIASTPAMAFMLLVFAGFGFSLGAQETNVGYQLASESSDLALDSADTDDALAYFEYALDDAFGAGGGIWVVQ